MNYIMKPAVTSGSSLVITPFDKAKSWKLRQTSAFGEHLGVCINMMLPTIHEAERLEKAK